MMISRLLFCHIHHSFCFFTICNYEQVLRDILSIERVNWDLIILDEGQRIKNWEAKTSRVIKGLRSRFALVLSGTPLENRLDELYSVVQFIDDRRLGPAFRFYNRHRVVDEKGKVLGYKNLSELRENLRPILLRRTRESVRQQLPPRTNEIVRITPTQEQLDQCISAIRRARENKFGAAVHCTAGLGRTGTVIAAWYVANGLDAAMALAKVREIRPGSVETADQEEAVREYAKRLGQSASPGIKLKNPADDSRPPPSHRKSRRVRSPRATSSAFRSRRIRRSAPTEPSSPTRACRTTS